jgi:predicted TIM-barrel fold metal-dependent hydrolase
MNDIPIFDSLTHPTLDGSWIKAIPSANTLRELEAEMSATNVRWAFAVGMKGVGGYREEMYADYVRTASQKILPIAYFDYQESETRSRVCSKLDIIAGRGYVGIKLHPRFSGINLRSKKLPGVLLEAARRQLAVLICTYTYGNSGAGKGNSYLDVGPLLERTPPDCKVVLLHGGDVNVLAMMEITRQHPTALLDLSFTICRYEGSSIDIDIRYLIKNFDRRICVGSDSPQFSLHELRRRLDELTDHVQRERVENVSYRNLLSFVTDKL